MWFDKIQGVSGRSPVFPSKFHRIRFAQVYRLCVAHLWLAHEIELETVAFRTYSSHTSLCRLHKNRVRLIFLALLLDQGDPSIRWAWVISVNNASCLRKERKFGHFVIDGYSALLQNCGETVEHIHRNAYFGQRKESLVSKRWVKDS